MGVLHWTPCRQNNNINVVSVPKEVNQALANLYSSKTPQSGNKTLRDWLSGKTFKEQYDYGRRALDREMKKYESEKNNDKIQ
jgi:hypothetical protein